MLRQLLIVGLIVSATQLLAAAPKGESGMIAVYSDGLQRVTCNATQVSFSLKADESIDPRLKTAFEAQWTGSLNIVKQARYAIQIDGAKAMIRIDGKPVEGPLALDIGLHPITIEYKRAAGPARLELIWSSEDFFPEPIPQSFLFHEGKLPSADDIDRGRLLVESFNCVACHRTQSVGIEHRGAPDLKYVATRLQPGWIDRWLADPKSYRHNSMMPRMPLLPNERGDIAAYLQTLKDAKNPIKEESAKPSSHIANGHTLFDAIGCAACHANLDTNKEDPSKIALFGIGSKWWTGQLAAYLENPLAVDPSGRMPGMLLNHDEARDLSEYLTESRDAVPTTASSTTRSSTSAPSDSIARGKALIQSSGCVRCHAITSPAQPAEAEVAMEKIRLDAGCLADHPAGKAMDYGLSADQKKSILAFVTSIRRQPLVSQSPIAAFYHKVQTLGCVRCHELDGSKPGEASERIPMLTDIGARMRKEWMSQVLTQRNRARPWLKHRMPEFGSQNVGMIPDLAVAVAGVGDAQALEKPTREQIIIGQKLLGTGTGGLACITCHGFAGAKPQVAEDTRGPDLTTAAARLRPDHFRRWVYDPKRVNPSTPMPSFFDGVPVDDAVGKIQTMLDYCALGPAMPPPVGWADEHNYVLTVHDTPVIQRAFMPDLAGGSPCPRGIAVGLPGLINYCFDADSCTLKYAWSGGFIDMKPLWESRGFGGQATVKGNAFWASDHFPFKSDKAEIHPQFLGYSLRTDGFPQWSYRVGDAEIRETITAAAHGTGIVRQFSVDPHGQKLTFSWIDKPAVTFQCTLPLQKTEFQLDPKSPNKTPGQIAWLGENSLQTFSLAIVAKEEK